MAYPWNKETVIELIRAYNTHEVLWKVTHPFYRKREQKLSAQKEIASSLNVSVREVVTKLHNLRCQYNAELRKMRKKAEQNQLYRPTWEFFSSMQFISTPKDFELLRKLEQPDMDMPNFSEDSGFTSPVAPKEEEEKSAEESKQMPKPEKSPDTKFLLIPVEGNTLKNSAPNKMVAFAEYIKDEMYSITDDGLQDSLRLNIVNLIYQYKNRQRELTESQN